MFITYNRLDTNDNCQFESTDKYADYVCVYCGGTYSRWSLLGMDYRSILVAKCSKRKIVESFNNTLDKVLK